MLKPDPSLRVSALASKERAKPFRPLKVPSSRVVPRVRHRSSCSPKERWSNSWRSPPNRLKPGLLKRFAHKHRTLRKLGVRKIATMFWHSFACTHRPWPPCPSRGPGNNEPASTARASDGLAQVYRKLTEVCKLILERDRSPDLVEKLGATIRLGFLASEERLMSDSPRSLEELHGALLKDYSVLTSLLGGMAGPASVERRLLMVDY